MNGVCSKLRELCGGNAFAEIYRSDERCFALGIPICVSENSYVYMSISKAGRADGIRFGFTKDIYRVCGESRYIDKYKRLMELLWRSADTGTYSKAFPGKDLRREFLKFAKDSGKAVTLYMGGDDPYELTCFPLSFDGSTLKLREIDEYGTETGISHIDISSAVFMSCDSETELIAEVLYKAELNKEKQTGGHG